MAVQKKAFSRKATDSDWLSTKLPGEVKALDWGFWSYAFYIICVMICCLFSEVPMGTALVLLMHLSFHIKHPRMTLARPDN